MIYHIVAGEMMKKQMQGKFDPIPFNEDMSVGSFVSSPFSDDFIKERSAVHHVSEEDYSNNMKQFFDVITKLERHDIIHLYFGEDITCLKNRELLISYFIPRVDTIYLHHMDEYAGKELSNERIK